MRETEHYEHYGEDYFAWQQKLGEFSAKANLFRFVPYVRPTDRVVDFGCGGGYLLSRLKCAERIGVEINPTARQEAQRQNIKCFASSNDLPDGWADLIISHSALEHVEAPLTELRQLFSKARPGGLLVFSVPHESLGWAYKPDDINQHLYTWSPMAAGNLFRRAGFQVRSVSADRTLWPPKFEQIYSALGEPGFRVTSKVYRFVRLLFSPVKPFASDATLTVVADRPVGE